MGEFPGMDPGFNLPWGALHDPRAPWNQDEFPAGEYDEHELVGHVIDREGDAAGGVAYEGEDGTWWLELPDVPDSGPFESFEEAVSLLVCEREYELEEELDEIAREAAIDAHYG